MKTINLKTACVIAVVFVVVLGGGCDEPGRMGRRSGLLGGPTDLGPTIGSLATIYSSESAVVEGYALVGGLQGTGSSECPPSLRAYLKRYILRQLPQHRIDVDQLIDSYNTAIVHVLGELPSLASKERRFDVVVTALAGTQTTSLEGGWLYGAELRVAGRMGLGTRAVANVGGPVFTNRLGDFKMSKRVGYVLGGAEAVDEPRLSLVLHKGDYEVTSNVRNRINERFGFGAAKAVTPSRIELTVSRRYAGQKQRFVSLVEGTYMTENPEITAERILAHIRELVVSEDKYAGEMALEAIGNASLGKLSILLDSADEQVRLHAARCVLKLGGDEGLRPLIEIALNRNSDLRIEALEALTNSADRSNAAAISRRLLDDADFDIRLAAYDQLVQLEDLSVARQLIGRSFYLDQVARSEYKGIFVSRSGRPRIALLGAPITCRDNIFVQSQDGSIILNAPRGQKYISVIRKGLGDKRAEGGGALSHLRSSFDLADIIRVLCAEPQAEDDQGRGGLGLGVSYSEMTALVKQLSDNGAVRAEFRAGPMPKIGVNIKK
ncbi:MAG: flagellar basal body P-ring protein FlgI [Phycisphaerae bacterium]|nr:flagellar basal body P-ring protein FlgI [Phycisphaerae bacterium]